MAIPYTVANLADILKMSGLILQNSQTASVVAWEVEELFEAA
jgi:hypothetical protein